MKKIGILLATFFLVNSAFSQGTDYRGCTWGDSLEKVIKIEGDDFIKVSDTDYAYSRQLGDYEITYIHYLFKENKLIAIQWLLSNTSLFSRLAADLEEKYGTPTYSSMGMIRWKTGRTIIELSYWAGGKLVQLKYSSAKASSGSGL